MGEMAACGNPRILETLHNASGVCVAAPGDAMAWTSTNAEIGSWNQVTLLNEIHFKLQIVFESFPYSPRGPAGLA